jgi:hypothetical protein
MLLATLVHPSSGRRFSASHYIHLRLFAVSHSPFDCKMNYFHRSDNNCLQQKISTPD